MKTVFLLLTLIFSFSNADTLKNAKEKWPFCDFDLDLTGFADLYLTFSGKTPPQEIIHCDLEYLRWHGNSYPPFQLKSPEKASYTLDVKGEKAIGSFIGGSFGVGPSDWKDLITAVKNFNMQEYTVALFDNMRIGVEGFYFRSKDQDKTNYVWVSDSTVRSIPLETAMTEELFVALVNEDKIRIRLPQMSEEDL